MPRWLFSIAINVRLAANSSTPFGVANRIARHLRVDAWTQEVHRRHLAVRARSILGEDSAMRSSSGAEDVIRNLSSILERQVATGEASPQPERSPFDAFPPTTQQLALFASELMPDGTAPNRPIKPFMEVLALSNVAFMQNHMHNFLRDSKPGRADCLGGLHSNLHGNIHVGSNGLSRRFQPHPNAAEDDRHDHRAF